MALGSRSSDELSPHLHVARDKDLLLPDAHLNSVMLDEMWEWFYDGMRDQVDPQLLFVKLINSVRKPYRDHISIMRCSSTNCTASSEGTATDHDRCAGTPHGGYENKNELGSGSGEQSNLRNQALMDAQIKYMVQLFEQCKASLASTKRWLASTNLLVLMVSAILLFVYFGSVSTPLPDKEIESLGMNTCTPDEEKTANMMPIRVAIKSAAMDHRYVQLHGSGVTSFRTGGGGRSGVHTLIGGWETFELIPADSNDTHIVCFKSIAFSNVYLHAEAEGVQPGRKNWWGGGIVNTQYGCGSHEKFRVWANGQHGTVSIESVAFPGRFLRMGRKVHDSISLQGFVGEWEKFYIVLVP